MRENWEEVKLGEIAKVKGGKRLPKNHELISSKTDHKYIRARDIKGGKINFDNPSYITEDTFSHISRYIVNEDDLILTIVGANIGDIALVSKEFDKANLTENAVKIISNKSKVVPKFLLYYLLPQYSKDFLQILASGAAQDKLGLYKINILNISLPPLETQRKIANILSAYDDLIENNQKRILLCCELAKTKFMALYKVENNWKTVKLDEVCNYFGRGVTPKYEEGTRFFGINQKANNGLTLNKEAFKEYMQGEWVPQEKYATKGDLLINSLGEGTIGRVHYYMGEDNKHPVDQHISIFRAKNSSIGLFVFQFFNSKYGQGLLHTLKKGGTNMTMLNIGDLRQIKIEIPSGIILENYYKSVINLFKAKAVLEDQNERLRKARDILLPRLMMGMIDVSGSTVQVGSVETKPTDAKVIPLEQPKREASKEFKEAVLIACLTEKFGSEKFPLGRKRYTKLSYLFHRYSDNKIQDYLRKAAGPYNPKTKYGGPEKIALNSKYIQNWKGNKGTTGFTVAEKIDDAKKYFSNYWQVADLDWLTNQFKFKSNDELELLATVDNSLIELSKKNIEFTSTNVLDIIKSEKEWEAKLERTIFSNVNVERAIGFLTKTLQYEK